MTPELKPCPFCGKPVFRRDDGMYAESFTQCQDQECAGSYVWDCFCDKPIPASLWNRRTPDLTEALTRLKALEEEMRGIQFVGQPRETSFGKVMVMPQLSKWTKEIAAIRKALGTSDAEPKPEPEH